jgi:choline dehydrogenase
VSPGCFVHRVVFAKHEPARRHPADVGVEYVDRFGDVVTAYARREVVVSAGALFSPKVLMLSGIGDADELRALGIPVVQHLPRVGANFYDDVGLGVISLRRANLPPQPYGFVAAGVFASRGGAVGAAPRHGDVNLEIQVSSSDLPGAPVPIPRLPFRYMVVGVSNLHLQSRGSVTLASADPRVAPVVDPGYLTDPGDLDRCVAGLKLALEIATDVELVKRWKLCKLLPPVSCKPVLENYVRSLSATVQHYVGTCSMGTDPSNSVVDPSLRVHGVPGLRVIDASVAPTPVTGNTVGVSMIIGARGARAMVGPREAEG